MEEDKQTQEQIFENFKQFFYLDMKVKQQMMLLAPKETDDYDEETRLKYVNTLYKSIETIGNKLKKIMGQFVPGFDIIMDKKINETAETLYKNKIERGTIQDLYRKSISSMDEKLVEEVKKNFVGYINPDFNEIFQKSNTLNEMLHICHSYIMNNKEILQKIPIVQKKENERKQPIYLRGENTEFGLKILESIPTDIDSYSTDLVAVDNKVFMMIRDLGHALTVELEKEEKDNVMIRYFVPKICNEEMIRNLPGIDVKTINDNGAYGSFETLEKDISREISDFLEKVPTDEDIPAIDYNQKVEEKFFKKAYQNSLPQKRESIANKIKQLIYRTIFKDKGKER